MRRSFRKGEYPPSAGSLSFESMNVVRSLLLKLGILAVLGGLVFVAAAGTRPESVYDEREPHDLPVFPVLEIGK